MKDLQQSNSYYNAISSHSQFRILIFEPSLPSEFKIVDCNENALQNNKANKAQIIGKTLYQLLGNVISSQSLVHLNQNLNKTIFEKTTINSEERVFINRVLYIKKNQFIPIFSGLNEVKQVLLISYLTNNLENSKDKLVESNAKFQSILNTTFAGVLVHKNGIALNVNKSFLEMFGYTLDEVLGKNIIQEIVMEGQRFQVINNVEKHITTPYEVHVNTKNGSPFNVIFEASFFTDSHDELIGIIAIRDITPQKRTKLKLIKAKNELSKFQKFAKIGGWVMNIHTLEVTQTREHQLLFKHFATKTHLSFQEFILKSVHPEDLDELKTRLGYAIINAGQPNFHDQLEFRIQNKNKRVKWLRVNYFHKSTTELQGFTQDITSFKTQIQSSLKKMKKAQKNGLNSLRALSFSQTGHFEYSFSKKQLVCSKEVNSILSLNLNSSKFKFIYLFKLVNPYDKFRLIQFIRNSTTTKDKVEIILETICANNQTKKIKIIAQTTFKRAWPESIFGIIQELIPTEKTATKTIGNEHFIYDSILPPN